MVIFDMVGRCFLVPVAALDFSGSEGKWKVKDGWIIFCCERAGHFRNAVVRVQSFVTVQYSILSRGNCRGIYVSVVK